MSKRERNEEIGRLYIGGKTLQELADEYGVSRQAIQNVLVGIGVPRRTEKGERKANNHPPITDIQQAQMIIEDLKKKVDYYRKKCRTEQSRNLMLRRYYKQKLLKELSEG